MNFKNEIKKAALGLAVLGLAVGASAFTNKTAQSGYLTNNGTDYDYRSTTPGTCEPTSPKECRYEILEPANVPVGNAPFTDSEIQTFLANDWIAPTNGPGEYQSNE